MHETTKRIPADVFATEREFLRALPPSITTDDETILRTVCKDITIVYEADRYSVPLDTFTNQKEVRIEVKDGTLHILTVFGKPICENSISTGRGMLVKSHEHGRDRESALNSLMEALLDVRGPQIEASLWTIRYGYSMSISSWDIRKRGSLLICPSSYYFHKNPPTRWPGLHQMALADTRLYLRTGCADNLMGRTGPV